MDKMVGRKVSWIVLKVGLKVGIFRYLHEYTRV